MISDVHNLAYGQNVYFYKDRKGIGKGKFLYSAVSSPYRTAQSALHLTPWQTCSFKGHFNLSGKRLSFLISDA